MFVCVCIHIKLQNKGKILITTQHLYVISLINLKRLYLRGEKFYIVHVLVQRLSLKTEKFLIEFLLLLPHTFFYTFTSRSSKFIESNLKQII